MTRTEWGDNDDGSRNRDASDFRSRNRLEKTERGASPLGVRLFCCPKMPSRARKNAACSFLAAPGLKSTVDYKPRCKRRCRGYAPLMAKPLTHKERFPDFGVPHTLIRRGSIHQHIMSYAVFLNRNYPPGIVTFERHKEFRLGKLRIDKWNPAVRKLHGLGWLENCDNGYTVTALGIEMNKRIVMRNAQARQQLGDD